MPTQILHRSIETLHQPHHILLPKDQSGKSCAWLSTIYLVWNHKRSLDKLLNQEGMQKPNHSFLESNQRSKNVHIILAISNLISLESHNIGEEWTIFNEVFWNHKSMDQFISIQIKNRNWIGDNLLRVSQNISQSSVHHPQTITFISSDSKNLKSWEKVRMYIKAERYVSDWNWWGFKWSFGLSWIR